MTVSEANSTLTVSLSALTNSSFFAFKPILAFSTWALGFSTLVPNADETNFTDAIAAMPPRQNKASQIVLIIGVPPDASNHTVAYQLRPRHGCPLGFGDFNRNFRHNAAGGAPKQHIIGSWSAI